MPGRSQTGTKHPFLKLHPSPSNSGEYANSIVNSFRSCSRSVTRQESLAERKYLQGNTPSDEKRRNCEVLAGRIGKKATIHAPTASSLDLLDGRPHVQFEQKNTWRMVDSSAIVRRAHPITFGLFVFVSFIVAVIASTLVADYNSHNNAPTMGINNATRFLLFAGHGVAIFLTWIFYLAGAAALTDRTGGSFNCADKGYPFPYCNSTKALMAFAWIGWIILTLMLAGVAAIGAGAFRGGRSVKESLA
ncbi:hypothetical protein PHSY_001053 [Pseudozyma hubeiensis SY62]|uniref:MARVEL domain-containing protein n=1 Tax=Pseudozyma hubeiensis (strain SY62) TaxID=1305764 RepID=R9NXN3_PSEHS|nr:hypothetical protein PHSY_001053 [Pseudozyma hubeiensis SY62]GAC93488.1 hypothetical protein PHSY_001053 [Pseudozyma hubeiensis SY62]